MRSCDTLLDPLETVAQLAQVFPLHLVSLERGDALGQCEPERFDLGVALDSLGGGRLDQARLEGLHRLRQAAGVGQPGLDGLEPSAQRGQPGGLPGRLLVERSART